MKKILVKMLGWLFILSLIGGWVYFWRAELLGLKNRFYNQYFPCQKPITYSLDKFDTQFGMSQKSFLTAVSEAEKIWEKPISQNLFEWAPSGTLKINLIFDYRQEATIKLRALGIEVKDDQATYDKLKKQYAALEKNYLAGQAVFKTQAAALTARTEAFNAEVASWNRKGRATPETIERLKAEEAELKLRVDSLNAERTKLNNQAEELNALADTLNRLAQTLNLSTTKYNTIGESRGREFAEGTFVSSASGEAINIYQFDDKGKLVRVLAHELGHALGLGHVSTTKAIMYYLNNGVNEKLTPTDLLELKRHCGLK
ncbi:MAG: matrixin family metalloprotease [Candidatus Magasanikbacteria bacterium]|nr:matrixin family metalloprotease [Candidatus Magasanikbacteria bacterium]